jgi:heme O synthase-like polyprenyltransferase
MVALLTLGLVASMMLKKESQGSFTQFISVVSFVNRGILLVICFLMIGAVIGLVVSRRKNKVELMKGFRFSLIYLAALFLIAIVLRML